MVLAASAVHVSKAPVPEPRTAVPAPKARFDSDNVIRLKPSNASSAR